MQHWYSSLNTGNVCCQKVRGNRAGSWGKTDLELSVTRHIIDWVCLSLSHTHLHRRTHGVYHIRWIPFLTPLSLVDLIYTLWEAQTDNKGNLFQALKYIWFISMPIVVKLELGLMKTWHWRSSTSLLLL